MSSQFLSIFKEKQCFKAFLTKNQRSKAKLHQFIEFINNQYKYEVTEQSNLRP